MVYLAKRTCRKEALDQQCQENGTCFIYLNDQISGEILLKSELKTTFFKQRIADAPLGAKGVFLQNSVVFLTPKCLNKSVFRSCKFSPM